MLDKQAPAFCAGPPALPSHRQALLKAWRLTGLPPAGTSYPLGNAGGVWIALCETACCWLQDLATSQIALVQKFKPAVDVSFLLR